MVATIPFSVPANNNTAGHATTQTSLFLHAPTAPSGDTTVFDWYIGSNGGYFRLTLKSTGHLLLEFSLTGYGTATADLGLLPANTWTWITCGFTTAGGLNIRGDVTPAGGGTTTVSALASSGTQTGVTYTAVSFGAGVSFSSANAAWPNNQSAGWLMSKLLIDQLASNLTAGNPRPMPTTDFAALLTAGEYLGHDPLGAATQLIDSGTQALNLTAGAQGLTIVTTGPTLQPLIGGPAGPHEGDVAIFKSGAWINLHIGTAGQGLAVVNGYPAWVNGAGMAGETIAQAGTNVATRATLNFATGQTVADNPGQSRVDVSLAPATASAIGGIIVGSGLAVTSAGVLSVTGGSGGVGTVTSVALTAPSTFTVTGSPITAAGTLVIAWANQSANTVLAGPSSGAAAAPTFRGLVPADVNLTTEGDLLYDHSGALTRLAVGTSAGFALLSNTTDPYYGDAAHDGPTRWEPTCDTSGSCLVDSSGAPVMALAPNR